MINGHGDDAYKYSDIRIDFSSNICAHASHRALMEHLAARPELLSHYPEPEAWTLERQIALREGIDPECVIATSGATEAIYLIAACCRRLGLGRAVIPSPTFSEYADACAESGLDVVRTPLGQDDLIHGGSETSLWLCNPNNPTGTVCDQAYIDRMAASYGLLVTDQSYETYTDRPVMSPREGCRRANVVQIHSMTKAYGVPGLRLGYITANARLTTELRHHLRPWAVSALAIEAGRYLLAHDELICRPDLAEARRLAVALEAIAGVSVWPTQTNFMLCHIDGSTAAELKERLAADHHLLIRDASNFHGLTPQHFRIAAQTREADDALIAAITTL